jgi:hypothetical protein
MELDMGRLVIVQGRDDETTKSKVTQRSDWHGEAVQVDIGDSPAVSDERTFVVSIDKHQPY